MVLDNVFEDWGSALRHSKNGMLWIPIRKLMARARRKHELDLARIAASQQILEVAKQAEAEAGNPFLESDVTSGEEYRKLFLTNQQQMAQMKKAVLNQNRAGVYSRSIASSASPDLSNIGQQPLPPPMAQQQQQQVYQQDGSIRASTVNFGPPALGVPANYDIDMDGVGDIDMDVSWQGWDELIREFSQAEGEPGNLADGGRGGTVLGYMGTWW